MPIDVARVKELFLAVLDLPAPERNAYLDTACADDTSLRQQIEAMLSSHQNSGELLPRPAGEMLADTGNTEAEATAAFAKSNATGTQVESVGGADHDLSFLLPPTKPDYLGQLGHYAVQKVIGKGGFGIVLKAFDERLHRVVAIKVLSPAYAANGSARKRFIREARTAAAIKNEHVVGIYDVEEDAQPPYLAMEMIDGVSLQDKLDKHGPLGVKEILRIGMQTAEGLAAAHKQGLVHRDIKPGNILLENGVERVRITDFGLARAVDDATVTQSGTVAGTPMYMSPEQAEGLQIDHRSDLFSLGTVLYAMCTGHPPFRASGTHAVLKRVIDASPRPIREINNEIPEWLCDIISKLHAKKPEDRFQTAKEVAELLGQRLADVQAGREIGRAPASDPRGSQSLTPRLGTEDMTAKPRGESSSPAGEAPATTPGRERRVLAAILSVLAVIALVVYFTGDWRGTDKKDDAPTHATVVLGGLYDPIGLEKVVLHSVKITNDRMERMGKHAVELRQESAFLKKRTKSEAALPPGMYQIEVVCRPGYVLAKHQISPETPGLHASGTGEHVGMILDLKAGDRVNIQVSVEKERDGNWVKLFNGKNLDGWQKHPTEPGDWTVENGILVGKSGRLGYLFSERGDFANFHLRAKVKVNAGGDSGIFVRSKLGPMVEGKRKDYVGKKSPPGYEAQICNDASALRTGSLFLVQEGAEPALTREERKLVPPDQWCTLEVIADGPWLTVKVNGERTANVKNDVYTRGHIALQMWHGKTVVHFAKIEIKELPPTATLPDSPEQVLPALAGAWKGEYTQKIYGGKPDVKKISAVCVNDWIVGQRWLRQRVQLGDESFQSLTTYEPGAKAFRDYFFHSRGLIFGPSTGRWESATRTLTWTNLPEAGVVLLMTLRFVDANTFTGEILIRDKEGKTVFEMSSLMKRTAEKIAIDEKYFRGAVAQGDGGARSDRRRMADDRAHQECETPGRTQGELAEQLAENPRRPRHRHAAQR